MTNFKDIYVSKVIKLKSIKLLFYFIALCPLGIYGQTVIKMQKEGGVFTVPCTLNGVKLKFIFDTGASDVSISLTEANFLLKNKFISRSDILGKENYRDATGSINVGTKLLIRKLEFFGLVLDNVEASIVHQSQAPLLLGQTAMAKLGKFQFDPTSGTLTILNGSANNFNTTKNILYYIKSAENKTDLKDYSGAIEDYTNAFQLGDNDDIRYHNRAWCKAQLTDHRGALADYSKAIELNPNDSSYWSSRATCKKYLKDITGAYQDLSKALELDSKNASAYFGRGILLYYDYNQKERACEDWSTAGNLGYKNAYVQIAKYCN